MWKSTTKVFPTTKSSGIMQLRRTDNTKEERWGENRMKNETEDRIVCPDYKNMTIEKVGEIEDYWILREIYRFIINITKEGG